MKAEANMLPGDNLVNEYILDFGAEAVENGCRTSGAASTLQPENWHLGHRSRKHLFKIGEAKEQ
jgi:hypothetical protein